MPITNFIIKTFTKFFFFLKIQIHKICVLCVLTQDLGFWDWDFVNNKNSVSPWALCEKNGSMR